MAYISSDKIRVFPSVGRSNYDIESQLMNENNISQIVRSLCRSRKDYVLSTELSTGPFEFVIYGFYFKILDASNTLSSITSGEGTKEVWAGIKIDANAEANNTSSNYQLLQLANTSAENNEVIELDAIEILDKEDKFQGIIFGTTEDEVNGEQGENYHTLRLLVKDGGTFKVPAQSLLHLNTTEILDGASSNYTSDKFTTKQLDVSESISDVGTLNVGGHTTLSTLTATDAMVNGTLTVTGETTLSSNLTANGQTITASTFVGSLNGNANTASSFIDDRTISLTGAVSGSSTSTNGNHSISTTLASDIVKTDNIADSAVTTGKIEYKSVTNEKIADSTIKTAKLGFGITMTLTVNDGILIISLPTLTDK